MAAPPAADAARAWAEPVRFILERYEEPLLRRVFGKLTRARASITTDELIDKALTALDNPVTVDRRLKELPPDSRQLLGLIGRSRQTRWPVGQLLSLLAALGHDEGLTPVLTLLEDGLLFPDLPAGDGGISDFAIRLGQGVPHVLAPPLVTERARGEDLGLPALEMVALASASVHEADGSDLPLRLAVLWQQASDGPFRRTQSNDFFKRDLARLRTDPLLTAAAAEQLAAMPEVGLLTVELALLTGILVEQEGELRAGEFPASWRGGLSAALADLWAQLPRLSAWGPIRGWQPDARPGANPYPSALLLALSRLDERKWVRVTDLESWVNDHHPAWQGRPEPWGEPLLLGLAFQMRLVQAARDADQAWRVRLTPLGRWLLGGPIPPPAPEFRQTLLVQPNFEVLLFRQGLTPALLADLARLADFKQLGAACQMQLAAERVYRGLEAGLTFDGVLQLLGRHGMRPLPEGVHDALKTWANKRDRVVVYAAATLVEFATAADLESAVARGLVQIRLTDRLALVPDGQMDYRQFRLTGTRDYHAKPERCLTVQDDGLTLVVDPQRSDLLLESELARVAEPRPERAENGGRVYELTQASLQKAERDGLTAAALDEWLAQRSGQPLSAAAKLLLAVGRLPELEVKRRFVLEVPSEEIADGLEQLPATRGFIERRLGPTALLIGDEGVEMFLERVKALGIAAILSDTSEKRAD